MAFNAVRQSSCPAPTNQLEDQPCQPSPLPGFPPSVPNVP